MSGRLQAEVKATSTSGPTFTPMRTGLLQRQYVCGGAPGLGGECWKYRDRHLNIQRRAANQDGLFNVPPVVHEVLHSPGQALDARARRFMESRFGHDFSQVRVHTDARAAESARSVHALAYTVGRDVVFGAGKYAPMTSEGQRLLAHELTHVVQQRNGTARATPTAQSAVHENEAHRIGMQVASNQPVAGVCVTTRTMMAKDDDDKEEQKYTIQPWFSTAVAEREKQWPETGLYYNGITLGLRRRGELVFQLGAHSGRSDKDYEIDGGPIPDGKQYFLSPHITKPPVKTYQYGGIGGALGIDSGYQKILDEQVQGAWGKERIAIEPANVCVPLPANEKTEEPSTRKAKKKAYCSLSDGRRGVFRGGFYLHGGEGNTTSGCIKVKDYTVFTELRKFGARVPLWVEKHKGSKTP